VSLIGGAGKATCTASSAYNDQWKCDHAFKNLFEDTDNKMWATKAQGAGSWIAVDMKEKMTIHSFTILNRKNPKEDNKDVTVSFDDG
jgi:hypothetical protein